MDEEKIIETGEGAKDGQTKCPKCGATDISLNTGTGKLRCNFCRFEFDPVGLDEMHRDVDDIEGEEMGSGAVDIDAEAEKMVTLKCTSCGAEVVINLEEASQARCHWCRNMLSINSKVPNGTVPDAVLPFKMKKEEARTLIDNFIGKRKFYADKTFRREFSTENIMGVYFPYMLVDMKGHASLSGEGEIKRGSYSRKVGKDQHETVYKVESFNIQRECDVLIDDLAVESSARRATGSNSDETNNIINAILPFDTENCVKYDSNYLKGFTSEKRDTNKADLQPVVDSQEKEAIKFALNDSVKEFDRGVRWDYFDVKKEGEKWLSAYLPVWLFSYVQNAGMPNQLTHYVAVNARTSETIGSVPVNKGRMLGVAFAIAFAVFIAAFLILGSGRDSNGMFIPFIAAFLAGGIFYGATFSKYRNTGARHHFETETKINLSNITGGQQSLRHFETTNVSMQNANNTKVFIEKLHTHGNE
ncbi:MAG: TFIIB-type zinc ribbon-containing protein [Lachnospiraceae bacterium]|nr:TFIIB-type zinc ribbon-containing protein [Lachnospiraceae bacterium]